ncbi:MAG: polymorphic toxin-type HINT domain-containing protein [Oscillospiraceae bacterium]|nr:MAG: polymorphic toxin-type HINT domain-containing protein [Oscillospiraceae bacterium]
MKYDCRNRLVSAGGISYEYDAENNRISQTENGAKTEYVVDSNSSSLTRILTAEKEGDTTYYIYGIGLIAQENGNEYLIYHFNNIGSTEAVTNIDGEIVETFDYGPYGELLSENKCGIMFLYNGELGVATDSNGLYYMRARYYNPEIKRFINQDVMTGSITDTPTLNRYAYVNGNPISLNDPFGLSPFLNWLDGITGHDILDLLGMLPGIGFVFDGINAAWYAQEGDYYNAACSLVSALPGAGDALGVFAKTGKSCKLVTAFHKTGSAGNLMIGSYELGKTADKYISGDASFTWEEIKGDLFKVAMTGTSMWGSAKDFGTSYCFVAGTLVTTEDGFKTIEEIEVGDKVLSEDETTGEVAVKTVTETYVNETDELVHIGVNGETVSATPTHPFYVDKLGWTLARSLRAGDVLVLSNGELVTVEWVQHEILESPIKVYNFEVEEFHTYFVGECGVLVHNKCTNVHGSGHGQNPKHKDTIDATMDDFAQFGYGTNGKGGDYDAIYGNKALSTAGLKGSQRPDIITVRTENGKTIYDIYEFASPSQYTGSTAYNNLRKKISAMQSQNPNTDTEFFKFHLFDWGSY